MDENNGWVRLHRKSIENGWLKNHKLWVFWSYCLMKATHKEHPQIVGHESHGTEQVILKPGQFIFGRKQASKDLKMSQQSIRTCYAFLKSQGNIVSKSTNRYSIVTICNWDIYQGGGKKKQPALNQQLTSSQPAANHKQECKKEKNEKKKDKYGEFVFLSKGEYQKLVDKYKKEFTDACIERLDNAIGSKGYKYVSHYRAILSWVIDDEFKRGNWEED